MLDAGALDVRPTAHHVAHIAQGRKVIERVTLDHDEVGRLSLLHGARLFAQPKKTRVHGGRRMQRKGVAHADVLGKVRHLAPHVVLRHVRAARIGAQAHIDPRAEGLAGTLDDTLAHDVAVGLLDVGGAGLFRVELGKGQSGRNGAREARFTARELRVSRTAVQLDDLRGHGGAVLDGVHAGLERHAHALGALHVSHHGKAELVCGGAGGGCDLRRHAQHAGLAHLGGVEHAARHEQLDHVGAVRGDLAHELRGALGTLGNLGEEPRAVPSLDRDARSRRDHARAHVLARIEPVAHGDVAIQGVPGAAHRGHTARKLLLSALAQHFAHHGAPQRIVELLHERTGVARARGPTRPAKMHMHVDEPRQQVRAAQVDHARPGWNIDP